VRRRPGRAKDFRRRRRRPRRDLPGDDALRERARANRLLFLRAHESDEGFARFVADSFALIDPLTNAVTKFSPANPERGFWEASTAGAFAYVIEGGVRNGLNWEPLGAVARPAARRLLQALRRLRGDEELGAWIEGRTDLGCAHCRSHRTRPSRASGRIDDARAGDSEFKTQNLYGPA
jgi:hypothetical protein